MKTCIGDSKDNYQIMIMKRDEALKLLKKEIKDEKILKHMLAVEAMMRKLASHLTKMKKSGVQQ
jgi:predicted hydrolase (HD superfamily)